MSHIGKCNRGGERAQQHPPQSEVDFVCQYEYFSVSFWQIFSREGGGGVGEGSPQCRGTAAQPQRRIFTIAVGFLRLVVREGTKYIRIGMGNDAWSCEKVHRASGFKLFICTTYCLKCRMMPAFKSKGFICRFIYLFQGEKRILKNQIGDMIFY